MEDHHLIPEVVEMENDFCLLKNVRLTYPSLHTKAVFDGKEENFYNAKFLISKEYPEVVDKIKEILRRTWDQFVKTGEEARDSSFCLYDGDRKGKKEFKNMWYINARSPHHPILVNEEGDHVLPEDKSRLYSGCYVDAMVRFWISKKKEDNGKIYPTRVNCYLQLVKHVAQGARLGIRYDFNYDQAENLLGVPLGGVIANNK